MDKRGFPRGQTTASRLKALFSRLEAERGRADAEAWLAAVRVRPEEIEDETRLLPLGALHQGLVAFVARLSEQAIADAAPCFIAKDNLGLWARLLRGTRSPEEAFLRLDGTESEYGRTTVWETVSSVPGGWTGRVRLAHDPRMEEDGLLARLRECELSVVPCLYGYGQAVVRRKSGLVSPQEYEVRWALPAFGASVAIGSAAGMVAAVVPAVFAPPLFAASGVLLGALVGGAAGTFVAKEQRRRIEARAQSFRVAALERSIVLRELREGSATGELVGSIVAGQYRLVRSMGSGASGVIYEAVRLADDRPVAIKLLRAAAAHDTVASDRLRREAEALGLAWHPNVVEALDHGHLSDGTSYLVMELLRGQSLSDRIHERGPLSAEELLHIALPLVAALGAIHAAGVVHRDIKPSNLFLASDEDGVERIKILDFGIARVEWEEMRITNLGSPMGTPGYMAPEQESGGEIDARSDLFALGATFYECLHGEPPSADASTRMRAEGERPRPVRADSGVHKASNSLSRWRPILERCLTRNPDGRYPDARTLLGDLRKMAEERPLDELARS